LKTMSWKPYPKISQAPKLRSQVLKTMSWKPYPKISQVFWRPDRHYSTQNQQPPYQKLSEKWLLITSLNGCSLEQKLQSVQELRRASSQPWGVSGRAWSAFYDGPGPALPTAGDWLAESAGPGSVGPYKSYAGLRHNRGGCRAGHGRPSVTDPAQHPPRRVTNQPGVLGHARSSAWRTRAPSRT
jgi:hypothetical protein